MDAKRSTRTEAQMCSGEAYSVVKCSNFSLATALQAAIALEEYDDVEEVETSSGSKRKREDIEDAEGYGDFWGEGSALQPQALPPSSIDPLAPKKSRKQRKKDRKNLIRKAAQNESFIQNTNDPRPKALKKHLGEAQTTTVSIDTENLPANSSGYEASFKEAMGEAVLNYDELIADGYELVEWDGTKPLIMATADTEQVFAVGVAKPTGDPTYEVACEAAAALLLECGITGGFTQEEIDENLRGPNFMAMNFGIGAGHGPPEPYNLRNDKHQDIVHLLRSSPALERMALHQSAALKFYFPELYDYYHEHTLPVRDRHKDLIPNWVRSIFCAAAVNLGPEVATYLHRDGRNLAFGQCAIHAFGRYDYKKGGHLVLKEPKLIIQFPPGCIILIPSATITHGNIPIRTGETRVSFTQYTAGALFRYVDNGFCTLKKLKKRNKKLYTKVMTDRLTRWEMGLGLWPTLEDVSKRASGSHSSKGKEAEDP